MALGEGVTGGRLGVGVEVGPSEQEGLGVVELLADRCERLLQAVYLVEVVLFGVVSWRLQLGQLDFELASSLHLAEHQLSHAVQLSL